MWPVISGGFKVGEARGKTKKGDPLMMSSYSANRDKHIWSSLRYVPETTAWLILQREKMQKGVQMHNFENTESWEDKASNT